MMNKPTKLNIFFEPRNGYAEKIATFFDEETYIECLPILKSVAKERKMFVTESESFIDKDVHSFQNKWLLINYKAL